MSGALHCGRALHRGAARLGNHPVRRFNARCLDSGLIAPGADFKLRHYPNFDDEMVDGTIDQFTDHPDWTLTLKHRAISDGVIAPSDAGDAVNSVSWQIDGEATAALDSGTWEAAFYSNLPAAQRTSTNEEDAVPTVMAGTFEAEYENVGRIIGAFGAHKQ